MAARKIREVVKVQLPPADGLAMDQARITNRNETYRSAVPIDRQLLSQFNDHETFAHFHAERTDESIALFARAENQDW